MWKEYYIRDVIYYILEMLAGNQPDNVSISPKARWARAGCILHVLLW